MSQTAEQPKSANAAFINAFLNGTIHTLKVQCSYAIKPGKPYLYNAADAAIPREICGVIGLTSNAFSGVITLCFSEKVFLEIMGSMFGETFTEMNPELADGAGELLNIIFGTAKTELTSLGYTMEKAIPTVIRGKGVVVSSVTGTTGSTIVVPFDTPKDKLFVLIGLGSPKSEPKLVK